MVSVIPSRGAETLVRSLLRDDHTAASAGNHSRRCHAARCCLPLDLEHGVCGHCRALAERHLGVILRLVRKNGLVGHSRCIILKLLQLFRSAGFLCRLLLLLDALRGLPEGDVGALVTGLPSLARPQPGHEIVQGTVRGLEERGELRVTSGFEELFGR